MCGITGYFSSNRDILSEREFAYFNLSLSHRGPDWSQQLLTKRGWIGHTKLSIKDTSELSNQPFTYRTKEGTLYRMVFNDEIHNFKQIREQLKALANTNLWTTIKTTIFMQTLKKHIGKSKPANIEHLEVFTTHLDAYKQ